ncbi:zinc finger protein 512 isoform X1 [Electrophorus electricus]|uniref:zinc finger protein 512 isoform X1 n=2 Tax=Electrophorus electricus TaxID=8005 RepID=UPI0015CFE06E|nr:zinc finger protein 512 isoform X1 [Electrophorus electricus]XP_035380336.1 zinc finger protein 512 isoform X1 [Electrophorus electricus]
MSAMYVPSKRKTSRPQLKPQMPEVLKIRKREVTAMNDEASSPKIKRTYGRKKYHDLQPVFIGPAEDSTGGSCTPVVQANLMNGCERQLLATGQATLVGMEERVGPSIEIMRESDFDMKKKRKMEEVGQASLKKYIEEVKQTVPVIVPVAHYTHKSPTGNSNSAVTQNEFSYMKKEVPSFPPGSQEERWQLLVLSKGRINCPKCKSVGRKTVEGLKKHMATCTLHPFTCQQCGKQLKTSTGMKYHLMADHSKLPIPDGNGLDDQEVKEKLRKVLKRMGKLKCSKEGCTGSFTSIMGYVYHMKKCGKEESELAKLLMKCKHCGKAYRSRAGLEYHLKSEHGPVPQEARDEEVKVQRKPSTEHVSGSRVKRMSAQVAIFHLQEIASQELVKEWPKRKVQQDLVPDDRKLRYSRPGLPAFSQEVLRKWKNEVKLRRKVQCPNKGCGCFYTSVSGLKAHLGLCTLGDFQAGKYKCLICKKEFNSESGVKYHINSVHSQDWFVATSKAKTSTSNKQLKPKFKDSNTGLSVLPTSHPALRFPQRPCTWQDLQDPTCEAILRVTADPETPQHKGKKGTQSRKDKATRQGKDCYEFSGSDSHSSTCETGSSSSESEPEEAEAPRPDVWTLNRPLTQRERARNIL